MKEVQTDPLTTIKRHLDDNLSEINQLYYERGESMSQLGKAIHNHLGDQLLDLDGIESYRINIRDDGDDQRRKHLTLEIDVPETYQKEHGKDLGGYLSFSIRDSPLDAHLRELLPDRVHSFIFITSRKPRQLGVVLETAAEGSE